MNSHLTLSIEISLNSFKRLKFLKIIKTRASAKYFIGSNKCLAIVARVTYLIDNPIINWLIISLLLLAFMIFREHSTHLMELNVNVCVYTKAILYFVALPCIIHLSIRVDLYSLYCV